MRKGPRSLEYLDALLSGGTARYPDVTARLDEAVRRRLGGTDKDRWLAARTGLDAALAETVALAADDVLLDDLLARLGHVPGAVELLLGVSVYGNRSISTRCCTKQASPTLPPRTSPTGRPPPTGSATSWPPPGSRPMTRSIRRLCRSRSGLSSHHTSKS
jgi:hypothetical protein